MYLNYQDGWTPLHAASQKGHVNIVKLLISKGASHGVQNQVYIYVLTKLKYSLYCTVDRIPMYKKIQKSDISKLP